MRQYVNLSLISLHVLNPSHENVNKVLSQIVSVRLGSQITHWVEVATFINTTELVKISKHLQSDLAASAIISKYLQKFKLLKVIYHTY